ncbi:MAG TPA: hypothetical protein VFS02_05915 [Telluria sp.]|nr:hypothetical protein [Telluria sp.]
MATQQPEDRDTGKGVAPDAAPTALSASGLSRRRFGKAGAGVSAGVLMTLVSQPGMAQTALCVSASGAASANLSYHSDHLVACQGVSPGFWKNHPEAWPTANTNPDTKYLALWNTGRVSRISPLSPYSCMQVLNPQEVVNGADPDNVAMHIMATLLNVRSGRIGFLTENQVRAIWVSYSQTGTYQPSAGITWNGAQIVDYLKKTMS